jgi:hypothetical protein
MVNAFSFILQTDIAHQMNPAAMGCKSDQPCSEKVRLLGNIRLEMLKPAPCENNCDRLSELDYCEDWLWSSFRHYLTGEVGTVEVESQWTARKRSNMEYSRQ